jgi:hypothetical protein
VKEYFVPWSPVLDINRIVSVEEHMRQYDKEDLGLLDRTVKFSRYKVMGELRDVDTSFIWFKEGNGNGQYPQATQFALVDIYLAELVRLGFNAFRTYNEHYISSPTSTEIKKIFDLSNLPGPTKTLEEEAYVINEGHRLGLIVMAGNMYSIGNENFWGELFYASPDPLDIFISSMISLNADSLNNWTKLGVDIVDLCATLSQLNQYDNTFSEATELNEGIVEVAESSRKDYSGPIYHGTHYKPNFFPGVSILNAPFWDSFDIVGLSGWGIDLTGSRRTTVSSLVNGWERLIQEIFEPFQREKNKPFLFWENGTLIVEGCANYGLICALESNFNPEKIDIQEMENYFISQNIAFKQMKGYFGPGWFGFSFSHYYRGGVRDTLHSTFRLKIEDEIQNINLGQALPRIIQIDGEFEDWLEEYIVATDPSGDANREEDITSLAFTQDDDYLYFKVEYASALSTVGYLDIRLDSNGDNREEFRIFLNNRWTDSNDWIGMMYNPQKLNIGFVDAIDNDDAIEFRVAKRYLEEYLGNSLSIIKLQHLYSISGGISDEIGPINLQNF